MGRTDLRQQRRQMVTHQFEIAVDALGFERAGVRGNHAAVVAEHGERHGSAPARLRKRMSPGPPGRYTPSRRLGLSSAATTSCVGDRRSLHLQQIYSKISPLG